jgi:hypothetical protein
VPEDKRSDQIVNTAFAIKSQHLSLVQIAQCGRDVYRRHLELMSEKEKWPGKQDYFAGLVARLPKRERLGRNPGGPCVEFCESARHTEWAL